MLIFIIYGVIVGLWIYNLFFKKSSTASMTTTTLQPTTTTTLQPTTTITTLQPTTTTLRPITTTHKPRTVIFSSPLLSSGGIGVSGISGGGGGAGGIVINDNFSITARNANGYGGTGYGAGGGGGGYNFNNIGNDGGNGSSGFVYIIEEDKVITDNLVNYTPIFYGSYTFVIMGGGGGGGKGYPYSGNGGDSGQIVIQKIRGISNETKISINIGAGGTSYIKGGDTIVTCKLKPTEADLVVKALGANPGNSNNKPNEQNYDPVPSSGGLPSEQGGAIGDDIINNMNSISPNIM
jgi:hypothetical protein